MAMAPSTSSTQYSMLVHLQSGEVKDTIFTIYDSNQNIIVSYTPTTSYQAILFSSDTLKENETYTIKTTTQETEITLTSITSTNGNSNQMIPNGPHGFGGNR